MTRFAAFFVCFLALASAIFPTLSHATLTNQTSREVYTGTGNGAGAGTATYSYGFKIFSADDLDVIVRKISDGTETTLTKTTHYTVTGVGNSTGGNVVLVAGSFSWLDSNNYLSTSYKITIRRKMDITQSTSIKNAGAYYPSLHENAFDKLTMISLQHQDELDRTMKVPWGDTVVDLTLPKVSDRASKFLAFNASGVPIASDGVTEVPVSTFMATVLDDLTAVAARTTLGFSVSGGILPPSLGGTGVANNDAATITRSGSHALTLTTTGTTNVTLPTSGTLLTAGTLTAPTVQRITPGTGPVTGYRFLISTSSTVAAGDTYTNNGNTYTVLEALSAQTGDVLLTSGSSAPTGSGTLTRATGSGTSSITFTNTLPLCTYTTPTSPRVPSYLKVKMVGSGGGGAGAGSGSPGSGADGKATSFNKNGLVLIAGAGAGGTPDSSGNAAGGTNTLTSLFFNIPTIASVAGGAGGGINRSGAVRIIGGAGGISFFGGAGASGSAAGNSAAAYSGSGGGGAGSAGSAVSVGAGGGAGGYIEAIIPSPESSYYVGVASGGTGGTAGTSGSAGGDGGSGIVIVEEYYQ